MPIVAFGRPSMVHDDSGRSAPRAPPWRIVHLAQRFHPATGGAETYVREIAFEQARRGHAVTVLTTEHPGAPRVERMGDGAGASIDVVRFPTRHWKGDYLFPPWLPMVGAYEWLARERPDLIHAHSYRFHTVEVGARASRAFGTPLVVSALGFYPPENVAVKLARLRYDPRRGAGALRQAARCVALTKDEVPYYTAMGVPAARVEVVPPGIPADALVPGDREGFRRAHALDGPVVMFLARLAHDKGLLDLIEAMPRVLSEHPRATLAIAGPDAGARAGAEARVAELGIGARVKFLGRVEATRDAYAAADVFVHPSHYESFGLVVVEAMAQRRAVVTTMAGGLPEASGGAAELVPTRDHNALAQAIATLLADPARREEMGERGFAHARTLLWPRMVDRLEECYGRALGR